MDDRQQKLGVFAENGVNHWKPHKHLGSLGTPKTWVTLQTIRQTRSSHTDIGERKRKLVISQTPKNNNRSLATK
jgi:hypothetical protein